MAKAKDDKGATMRREDSTTRVLHPKIDVSAERRRGHMDPGDLQLKATEAAAAEAEKAREERLTYPTKASHAKATREADKEAAAATA